MKRWCHGFQGVWGLSLLLLLAPLSGCLSLSNGQPPGPWYDAYEPMLDPEVDAFVARALALGTQWHGDPVVPVRKVLLRRSQKTEAARRYRIGEDFSLTELADSTNGLFVIYLGVDKDHPNFYALLGHECAHLLNPYITGWYMEGFATLFSERVCAEQDVSWGSWTREFTRSRRKPYALSYQMMRELEMIAPELYARMLSYSCENEEREGWLRIDIDRWLAELPEADGQRALNAIEPFVDRLKRQVSFQYAFKVPDALK